MLTELLAALKHITRLLLISVNPLHAVAIGDTDADLWASILDDRHSVSKGLGLLLQLGQVGFLL